MSESSFSVRDASPADRDAVRELTLAAYGVYADLMAPSAWEALRSAVLAALEAPGPADLIVAEQGGAVVGSVMLFPAAGGDTRSAGGRMIWPELRLLAVDAAARRQGIGAALVEACVGRARASGAPALGLYSSESMRAALELYERRGFVRTPAYDFQPPGAELVRAYHLPLVRA